MGFDLSSLINQATQFTENQQNNQNGGPKLVYPGPGTLKVKLLYNPKSNLVARQIKRHKVENASATCLGTYGMECPICKSVANIKNATGVDLWKFNASQEVFLMLSTLVVRIISGIRVKNLRSENSFF